MTDFIFLGVVVIGAVTAVLVFNKPLRERILIKIKGRTDEMAQQDAMTPEGAADYYNNAIREREEKYLKANQLLQK